MAASRPAFIVKANKEVSPVGSVSNLQMDCLELACRMGPYCATLARGGGGGSTFGMQRRRAAGVRDSTGPLNGTAGGVDRSLLFGA